MTPQESKAFYGIGFEYGLRDKGSSEFTQFIVNINRGATSYSKGLLNGYHVNQFLRTLNEPK